MSCSAPCAERIAPLCLQRVRTSATTSQQRRASEGETDRAFEEGGEDSESSDSDTRAEDSRQHSFRFSQAQARTSWKQKFSHQSYYEFSIYFINVLPGGRR